MIYALIPFAAFGIFAAGTAWFLKRNVRRTTRSTGVVIGKRFIPAHAGVAANGSRSGGNALVVPDSWVLEINRHGKPGTAVVSQETYNRLNIGDNYSG